MRINPKIYCLGDKETPIETQDVEGRKVEIYELDKFQDLYTQYLSKSKFAVWSSEDAINYRIFIEKGYYAELRDLYSPRINKIWLNFWDNCEKISNRFSYKIMMPFTLIAIVLYFILTAVLPGNLQIPFSIGILGLVLIVMVTLQRYTKSKIASENAKSVDDIKGVLGKNRFEELLNKQKNYIEDFYERMYPTEDETTDESPAETEAIDATIVAEKEVTENDVTTEEPKESEENK